MAAQAHESGSLPQGFFWQPLETPAPAAVFTHTSSAWQVWPPQSNVPSQWDVSTRQ